MASDDPPSSQLTACMPVIFPADSMPVYTQADIMDRPRLIRKMRAAGASIAHKPSDAQVILVDSTTDSGRQFIRDWGKDRAKIVLEYYWANRSLDARKPLLESDDFGGCRTHDDGRPIGGNGDEIAKSPLPTPRPTPFDAGPSSLVRAQSLTPPSSGQVRDAFPTASMSTGENCTPYTPNPVANSPSMQQPLSTPNGLQMQPYSQQPLDGNMINMAMNARTQSSNPMNNQVSQSDLNRMLATMMDIFRSAGNSMNGQLWASQMSMGMPSQGQINARQPTFVQQPQLNGMQPMSMDPQFQAMYQSSSLGDKDDKMRHHGSISPPRCPSEDAPSSEVFPTPTRRRTSSQKLSVQLKGKQRAVTPEPLESSQSPSTFSSPSPPPIKGEPRQPGQIFTSSSGEALVFFVQIDIRNRGLVIKKIKSNGGVIHQDQARSDYVILYSQSDTFNHLLRATLALNKVGLSAAFVDDCVQEEALLDVADYVLEPTGKRKGRWSQTEERRPRKNELAGERQREMKGKDRSKVEAKKKRAKRVKYDESPSAHDGRRSPSPPPDHTRQVMSHGVNNRYRYTTEEHDYALQYFQFCLERDHLLSQTAFANMLHRKGGIIPHHPVHGLLQYLSSHARSEMDNIRKRVNIARRKVESASQAQQSHDNPSTSKRQKTDVNNFDQQNQISINLVDEVEDIGRDIERDDIEVIVDFFASGGGNENDDDLVWRNLANHRMCKTNGDWPSFYQAREQLINDAIRAKIDDAQAKELHLV